MSFSQKRTSVSADFSIFSAVKRPCQYESIRKAVLGEDRTIAPIHEKKVRPQETFTNRGFSRPAFAVIRKRMVMIALALLQDKTRERGLWITDEIPNTPARMSRQNFMQCGWCRESGKSFPIPESADIQPRSGFLYNAVSWLNGGRENDLDRPVIPVVIEVNRTAARMT